MLNPRRALWGLILFVLSCGAEPPQVGHAARFSRHLLPLDGGSASDAGTADAGSVDAGADAGNFGDGCICICGNGQCSDVEGNCSDGSNCLGGGGDAGPSSDAGLDAGEPLCVCLCNDSTCAVDDQGNCDNGTNCLTDYHGDAGPQGDAGCVCMCPDGTCSINALGDCAGGGNCATTMDAGLCLCLCPDGSCSIDDQGDCAGDGGNCLAPMPDAGQCVCTCDDGTCSVDLVGDCDDDTNCLTGNDAGSNFDGGLLTPDAGCVCICTDGTCAMDQFGDCDYGPNCSPDGGPLCGVCTCSNGTCAIDQEGDCLDSMGSDAGNCLPPDGGTADAGNGDCRVCMCHNGTCPYDLLGDCSDGTNCLTDGGRPTDNVDAGGTGTTASSSNKGGCASGGEASVLGLLAMWLGRRRRS